MSDYDIAGDQKYTNFRKLKVFLCTCNNLEMRSNVEEIIS